MPSTRRGFTLIELLVVIVIIGILAAIAIPKYGASKEKAYVVSMKSDLRNLVTAEEAYFADHTTYTSDKTQLGSNFSESAGVTVTVADVSGSGWYATATHNALPATRTCSIWMGTNVATTNGAESGTPVCN